MLKEACCKGRGNEQWNPSKRCQGETTPLSLVCSHPECHSFRVVYGMRSRRRKKKRQSLHSLHSKTVVNPALHSSCFQSTATTFKNVDFWIRREVWMQLHHVDGHSCLAIPSGLKAALTAVRGLQDLTAAPAAKGPSPGHHFLHLLQGSIPPTPAACALHRPRAASSAHAVCMQLKQALKGTHNQPEICYNIKRKFKFHAG